MHEYTLQWKNILEIKEVLSLWDLKYVHLQKGNFESQGFQNVFNIRGAKKLEKEGPWFLILFPYL